MCCTHQQTASMEIAATRRSAPSTAQPTAGHRMSDSSVIFEPVSKVMATALAAGMASATCAGEVDQHEIGG